MASSSSVNGADVGNETSAAALLRQKHAEVPHHVTVEEVPDEDLPKSESAATAETETDKPTGGDAPSWVPPMSAKAAGKQKAEEPTGRPVTLDTQSHELFPELGAPKKANAGIVPLWGAKSTVNGKTNGTSPANGTSRSSTPASGVATPTSSGLHRPPAMSIPGRNIESLFLEPHHVLPRDKLRRPIPDIIKDINRKSRANITMPASTDRRFRFEATGPQDLAQQALKDLVNQIGTKVMSHSSPRSNSGLMLMLAQQTVKVSIPRSVRAHIIGKQGSTIKALQEKTGARIQMPKVDEHEAPADDADDDDTVEVIVEGNAVSAAAARDQIIKIAGERAANVHTKLRNIPAEFFPFIAGPKNSLVHNLEEDNGVQIRVPPHQAWSSQPIPAAPAPGQRPVFQPAQDDNLIQVAGDRAAVQAVRAEIERRAAELRQQLALEQLSIQRGRHQFIIGDRGMPVDDFFDDTGCAIFLPTDEDDDMITVIGPPERVQEGLEKAMDLAMNMQCSNIDCSRFHRQAPGGAAAHARNVTRYLRQRKEIERLEKLYNTHINTPFSQDGALPWELYARDGKNAIRAQSEIKGLFDSMPPSRISSVPVDPFFHQYLRNEVNPRVHEDYGVQLVVPDSPESESPILLVYEGPGTPDAPVQLPRTQPSQDEIRAFEQGLRDAREHIVDLINQQEAIKSVTVDVPQK